MVIFKFLRCLCVFSFKGDAQKEYRIFNVTSGPTGHEHGGGMRFNQLDWLLLGQGTTVL